MLVDEREVDRPRGELAIAAAGTGIFDWDLVTGRLDWDARLIEIFGYAPGTFDSTIHGFNDHLHPDDLDRVTQALQTAIGTCADFAAVYRVGLPAGDTRWVSARGRMLCDPDGTAVRLVGAAYDVTAFVQPDGATMLVIGDVAGHDTAAAATMGQLGSLLRGIATSHLHPQDRPGPAKASPRVLQTPIPPASGTQ